jgi:hypothetical protein
MLKLQTEPRQLFWLQLMDGVRVQLRPITMTAILIARAAAGEALRREAENSDVHASFAFTQAMARWGIQTWVGVGDANGDPIEPSPTHIDALLEHWTIFDALDRHYVAPALTQADEKNASSLSPNGTSAGATATALPAA